MNKTVVAILLLCLCKFANSQELNPDGYNIFHYPNGNISSEGSMKNGKPDGFWINYYENGNIMSEGNRKFFELDSTWNFYYEDGNINNIIFYRNGQKNGYAYNYDFFYNQDSIKTYYLKSKELYYLGIKEGLSYYYDKNNILKYTFTYKSDKRNGEAKEYDKDSVVITLFSYYNGYQIETQKINRKDNNNQKQGLWIIFYPNGNKKRETNYLDDKLHGIYREYDLAGNITLEKRYLKGNESVAPVEEEILIKAQLKKILYPDGNLQYEGAFVNNTAVGIHKEYSEDGKIITGKDYDSEGKLLGEGYYDKNGKRTGKWKLYDNYYNYYYCEGEYEKGLKNGFWKFFYPDGSIEQEGYYNDDIPDKEWIWYHKNGNKKVEEVYMSGKLEGLFAEYDTISNIILEGEYFDDVRIKNWVLNIGTIKAEGVYDFGEKHGAWTEYYLDNSKKYFEGSFKSGEEDGIHKWYYPNGSLKIMGNYRQGKKHKDWQIFNEDGTTFMTFTYKNGKLIKIDGQKTYNY